MGSWTPGEGHLGDLEATKSTVNKEEEKAPYGNRIYIYKLNYTQSQFLALLCYKEFTI